MASSDRALSDMHCHVGFMADPCRFVQEAELAHTCVLAVSATPCDYRAFRSVFSGNDPRFVFPALGIHPWWVPDTEEEVARLLNEFDSLFSSASCIGEIGLDFSSRRVHTKEWQLRVLKHILKRCTDRGQMLFSLHCVQAYPELFTCLEKSGALKQCKGIFHWFSGSSEHLRYAIQRGCYFSVSKRMLASKRGREYVKAIPENRLLLETDAPFVTIQNNEIPSVPYTFKQVQDELYEAIANLAAIRKCEVDYLAGVINKNAQYLLNLKDLMH